MTVWDMIYGSFLHCLLLLRTLYLFLYKRKTKYAAKKTLRKGKEYIKKTLKIR